MRVSNETKVGILTVVSLTILVLGYNFMKGKKLWSKSNTYYAVYEDIDGLIPSNPVVIRGYQIGQVNSVDMNQHTGQMIVKVSIPKDFDVPDNSVLRIINDGLVGGKAIELIRGKESTGQAQDGDTLASELDPPIVDAVTDVLTPISRSLKKVLEDVDSAVSGVDLQSTMQDLSDALNSFKQTAQTLNGVITNQSGNIAVIMGNIESITSDLKSSTPKIEKVLADLDSTSTMLAAIDFKEISDKLGSSVDQLKATLESISDGNGTLGKLATEDDLYNNLNAVAASLDSLAKDIQRYPDRYTGVRQKNRDRATERKNQDEGTDITIGKPD